jgi:hypothetical protein
MAGSIKLINANLPPKEGRAIVYVDQRGTTYKVDSNRNTNPVALSGELNSRFTQVTYYSA